MINTVLSVDQFTQVVPIGQSDQTTTILKNISFKVQKGELVSIVGPSGSGKSTLLYSISGITRPTSGTVTIAGVNPYQLKPNQLAAFRRQIIGFIFQQYNLIQSLPVFENIVIQQRLSHQQPKRSEIEQLLTKLNFAGQIDGAVETLSGGEQQKVAIARTILTDCDVLFADEPTGALDSVSKSIIFTYFKEMVAKGKTVIMVTHDIELASQTDRAIVLKDGQVQQIVPEPSLEAIYAALDKVV